MSGASSRRRRRKSGNPNLISVKESRKRWDAPVITLNRVPAVAIMERLKRCENRPFALVSRNYDHSHVPIGIHIKKSESKRQVVQYLKDNALFKRQLLAGNSKYHGLTPEEFYAQTQNLVGKIIGYIRCDQHRDVKWNYPHDGYPRDRGHVWIIYDAFQFRHALSGFNGGQTWRYINDSNLLNKYMQSLPV